MGLTYVRKQSWVGLRRVRLERDATDATSARKLAPEQRPNAFDASAASRDAVFRGVA